MNTIRVQCPKCKMPAEEVAPTDVWEHLIPDNIELHEYECPRCHYLWTTEREKPDSAKE